MQNRPFALPVSGESSPVVLSVYRLAALVFAGWITMLLLVPDPYATSRAMEQIRHAGLNGYLIHFSVYCLVSTFGLSCFRRRGTRIWWMATAILVAHACTTELLQMGVPGRSADVLDAAANLLGIATGTVIDYRLRQLCRMLAKPTRPIPTGTLTGFNDAPAR